jgi:SAM-dependent methyltransferase
MFFLIKSFNEKIGFPLRWKILAEHLYPYLKGNKSILDLGAGAGGLAGELIKKLPQTDFTGVDIQAEPEACIPVKKFNGRKIPYSDNFFDCVMIVDVLHHSKNPAMLLNEAKRVTKKYILIKDHYWKNRLDFFLLKFMDYFGNKPHNIPLPYNFLKIPDWKNIIKKADLNIIKSQKQRLLNPCRDVIYLLKK